MKIQIDRLTNTVAGINTPATPLHLEIAIDDGFTLSKSVEEITGYTEPQEEGQEVEPITETKTVTLETKPEVFTLEEVVQAKYKNMLEDSNCDYIIADIFLDENDLDLEDINHKANTGFGIIQLLPQGQAKTKTITLNAPSKEFTLLEFATDPQVDIYINDTKFIDSKVTLSNEIQSCSIKFINTTNKPKMVRAYAIGY